MFFLASTLVSVSCRPLNRFLCRIPQVPRKSDIFQADIYPDTYAGKPALENKEWLDGTNKDPEKTSMKPGQRTEKAAVEFKADKSPAELKAELKAANDRIAELEAEVAKLKAGS